MFGLGTWEIVVIAAILLLLFGSTRIPAVAKSIADTIKYLKEAFSGSDTKGKNKK